MLVERAACIVYVHLSRVEKMKSIQYGEGEESDKMSFYSRNIEVISPLDVMLTSEQGRLISHSVSPEPSRRIVVYLVYYFTTAIQ